MYRLVSPPRPLRPSKRPVLGFHYRFTDFCDYSKALKRSPRPSCFSHRIDAFHVWILILVTKSTCFKDLRAVEMQYGQHMSNAFAMAWETYEKKKRQPKSVWANRNANEHFAPPTIYLNFTICNSQWAQLFCIITFSYLECHTQFWRKLPPESRRMPTALFLSLNLAG